MSATRKSAAPFLSMGSTSYSIFRYYSLEVTNLDKINDPLSIASDGSGILPFVGTSVGDRNDALSIIKVCTTESFTN